MPARRKTSFQLTEGALELLKQLAEQNGIPQSAVLELLIREKAQQQQITLPQKEPP